MRPHNSHYPTFDVMAEQEHWDAHTRQIVRDRLDPVTYKNLTQYEGNTLFRVCALLLDEAREPILQYVVSHFDNKLSSNIGEGQRKKGIPKASVLLRDGLAGLGTFCRASHGSDFTHLTEELQITILSQWMSSTEPLPTADGQVPTSEFMTKVLTEAVSAYYSHPAIWSEIGYAGPAYPRGYVRTERGLTDPWEAIPNHAQS